MEPCNQPCCTCTVELQACSTVANVRPISCHPRESFSTSVQSYCLLALSAHQFVGDMLWMASTWYPGSPNSCCHNFALNLGSLSDAMLLKSPCILYT